MQLKILFVSTTIFLGCQIQAQTNLPDNSQLTTPPATGTPVSDLPGMDLVPRGNNHNFNYIISWEPQIPVITDNQVINKGHTVEDVHRTVQYFDGLGRPFQTVNWQQTPNKKDLVSVNLYDEAGREQYNFLPFEAYKANTNDTIGNGYFKFNAYNEQNKFYLTQYPDENFYYGHTIYEASPLNRPVKSFAPGNSWAGSEGSASEKAVTIDYQANTSEEIVRIWNITNDALTYDPSHNYEITDGLNIPVSPGSYTTGQLYKTVNTDEHGKRTIEYKDKGGHVVLKKVQVSDNPNANNQGWLCTYYVYDDFGLLRFTGWEITQAKAHEMSFHYEYDEHHRMIAKKVPGAAWVYMVYDNRDKLVYTQDGNMRKNNQWMTYCYDAMNEESA